MPTTDKRVDAYIEKAPAFARPILQRVRKAFHQGCPDVVETIKWSRPAFEYHGLLGSMAAFKQHASFGFWRGKELDDPEGLFCGVGDTEMCAASVQGIEATPTQRVLTGYVRRAAALNRDVSAGKKEAPRQKTPKRPPPRTPSDLAAALKMNAKAKATFDGFPPSCKREYVTWIEEAKRDATRAKRIATTIEWLAKGRRRNWKYE